LPDFSHVSWIAVLVAAVANIILGYVWFMPMVFGKRWEATGGNVLPSGTPPPMTIAYMVVSALLAALGLAVLFGGVGLVNGAIWGALVWLYFVAPVTAGAVFFQGRSWMGWAITAGYWLVGLIIMGAIVGVIV
jgi:hypothetical protein